MQRRALLLAATAALSWGCGPKAVAAPPRAPVVLSAADLLPADLDVVVRLDLGRVKASLDALALTALSREVLAASAGAAEGSDELVLDSLLAADVVYLAYRPGPLLAPLDRVLSLQGSFEQLVRPPPAFAPAVDLGGDLRFFERRTTAAPLGRGAVARVYTASTRVRAFVSEAEIDSVERALETGGAERRLEPPEEGTLSLAARPWLLARFAGNGNLRDLVYSAKALRGFADLESDGVRLKLELELAEASQAEQLAKAAGYALERLGGSLGAQARLRAEGHNVVLSARLERSHLAPLVGCLSRGSAAECAW